MAAVSAFVAGRPTRREAITFGFKWAVGHGFSLLLLGSILYVLKRAVEANQPLLFSSGVLEKVVGFVLLGLGLWMSIQLLNLYLGARFPHIHKAGHAHGAHGYHEHPPTSEPDHKHSHSHHTHDGAHSGHGSLWMGMLHGAAGTSAFIGQAAISLAPSYWYTVLYTGVFSVGVLLAMSFYAMLLGGVLTWGERRSAKLLHGARWATSLATCAIGVCLIVGVQLPGLFDKFMPH